MVIQSRFRRSGLVETLSVDMVSPEHLGGRHLVMDVTPLLYLGSWDAMIACPPCIYLSIASGLYLPRPGRRGRLQKAVSFFLELYAAPIPKVVVENPKHSNEARKLLGMSPSQCLHPHSYSAPLCKPTQLYVRGLPLLQATHKVEGRLKTLTTLPPTPLRGMIRARTFDGIAEAMAVQWTDLLIPYFEGRRATVQCIVNAAQSKENTRRHKNNSLAISRDALLVATAWIRHSSNTKDPNREASAAMQRRLNLTDGDQTIIDTVGQLNIPQAFNCWKRHTELQRGQLFGNPKRKISNTHAVQLIASQLMRRSGTEGFAQEESEKPLVTIDLTRKLPFPPIKRVVRRMGNWWAWIAKPSDPGHRHLHPKWVKVPEHLHALLESTTKDMQPQIVAANLHRCRIHGQAENRGAEMRTRWHCISAHLRKWARSVRLEQMVREYRQTVSRKSQILTSVERDLLPCPVCHKPRSNGGCPRGLGSISCAGLKSKTKPIRFVPASNLASSGGTPNTGLKVAAVLTGRRTPGRWNRPEILSAHVEVDETTEPELVPLRLPMQFGDDAVSNTPPAKRGVPASCAWVKDVLISTRNHNTTSKNALYLVGRAGVWSPATIADTGATISLIGTELLERLPHDAIAEFTPPQAKEVANVAGPNGEPLNILGKVKLLITISKVPFFQTFFIVRGGDLLLLGSDFLTPRDGDVRLRSESLSGNTGYCVLNHPKYGRVHLPLEPTFEPKKTVGAVMATSIPTATPDKELGSKNYLLYNQTPIRVAPRSERELLLTLPHILQDAPQDVPLLVRPLDKNRGIDPGMMVAYSFGNPRKADGNETLCIPVRVLNLSKQPATLQALTPLAELETGWSAAEMTEPEDDPIEAKKALDEVIIDPDGILTPEQTEIAKRTISKYYRAFAPDPKTPGTTHAMEVTLKLKEGAVPHRHAPPRLGMEARKWVREHVADLEKRGIIYRATGSWASRIVLVKKKDNSLRLCVDYRDLNAKLEVDQSPIPLMAAALQGMSESIDADRSTINTGAKDQSKSIDAAGDSSNAQDAQFPITRNWKGQGPRYWSSMDLAAGFHGLPLSPESQELTAMCTPDGRYQWAKLPFGVSSGPAAQVELMNNVMAGLQYNIAVLYLDDALTFSYDFETMVERISLILERFIAAGLTCKASKCIFFAKSIEFLGHQLSSEGIGVCAGKVKAIAEIDPTRINNITAVRSFIGACSYYRKFIRNFSEIARPLITLTKKGEDVATASQEAPAQEAIRILKAAMCSAPVLALPRWERRFIIHSDASTTGIGAVLCQENDDGHEQPVEYYGRVLTPAESRYTVSELELLALISCIRHWRAFLWSCSNKAFLVITDHAALLWLGTAKETTGGGSSSRLMRWYLELQEYNFTVKHKPGRLHFDADMISRMQGNPEYEKLIKTPEHINWLHVNSTTGGVEAKVGGNLPTTPLPTTITADTPNPTQTSEQSRHEGQPKNVSYWAGSLLDTPAEFLAHQCNCITTEAQGLAQAVFLAHPMANTYKDRTEANPHQEGSYSIHRATPKRAIVNLYAQHHPGMVKTPEEADYRNSKLMEALVGLSKDVLFPPTATIAFPVGIGTGSSIVTGAEISSPKQVATLNRMQTIYEWAVKNPELRISLCYRPNDHLPPELSMSQRPPMVASVLTRDPSRPVRRTVALKKDAQNLSTDLSIQETEELTHALENHDGSDYLPECLAALEDQLRKGRAVSPTTFEALITRLRTQGLALRASELLEIAQDAGLASKKAHYLALSATHTAALYLQSAPIMRRLIVNFQAPVTTTRKMLAELEVEFESKPQVKEAPTGYIRYRTVAKLAIISEDATKVWCHQRSSDLNSEEELDLPGGKAEPANETARDCLRRETMEEIGLLPPVMQTNLEMDVKRWPEGLARAKVYITKWTKMHLLHVWVTQVREKELPTLNNLEPDKHANAAWRPISELLDNLKTSPVKRPYADAIEKALRRQQTQSLGPQPGSESATTGPGVEETPEVCKLKREINLLASACHTQEEQSRLRDARWSLAQQCTDTQSQTSTVAAAVQRAVPKRPLVQAHAERTLNAAQEARQVWQKYSTHDLLPGAGVIREEQRNDLWCSEIRDHLLTEYIPPGLKGSAVMRFKVLASDYTLRGGMLFRVHQDPRLKRSSYQIAIPVTLREPFLEAFHARMGHPGTNRTYTGLAGRAYWPGMRGAVETYVNGCHECLLAKKPTAKFGTSIPQGVPSQPFEVVHADILTLPKSNPVGPQKRVYSKLLIFVDGLTRWVEAAPLPQDPTAEEVIEVFIEYVISRHGVPRALVCDRGSNLIAQLCREAYTILGVDLRPSTSYHHETAALVERFNRTLSELIRASADDGKEWPLHVPWICFFYRATAHSSTHESPAYLNLGRELRLPHDRKILDEESVTEEGDVGPDQPVSLVDRLRTAWTAAKEASENGQLINKEYRDLSRRNPEYVVNDWVLLRRPINDKTGVPQGGKLAPIFEGPYRVEEVLERGNVRLKDLPRQIHNEFHVSRLRPYRVDRDEAPTMEDGFKVETILDRRDTADQREYLVHWHGWPQSDASWEPRANLLTRCLDLVAEFDNERDGFPSTADYPRGARTHRRSQPRRDESLAGRPTFLVSSECWPDDECLENKGTGWEVAIIKRRRGTSQIRFVNLKDQTTRYADEWIDDKYLKPMNTPNDDDQPINVVAAATDVSRRASAPGLASQMITKAAQPSPPLRAILSKGVWLYERYVKRNGRRVRAWVDERTLSSAEIKAASQLRTSALATPVATTDPPPGVDQRLGSVEDFQTEDTTRETYASLPSRVGCPTCGGRNVNPKPLIECPEKICRIHECENCGWMMPSAPCTCAKRPTVTTGRNKRMGNVPDACVWKPLEAAHAPDSVLMKEGRANAPFESRTAEALAATLNWSRTPAQKQEEILKSRLYKSDSQPQDFRRYLDSLERRSKNVVSLPFKRSVEQNATNKASQGKFNSCPGPELRLHGLPASSLLAGLDLATSVQVHASLEIMKKRRQARRSQVSEKPQPSMEA